MLLPINLQTKMGLDFYKAIHSQFEYTKEQELLGSFRQYLTIECSRREKQLIDWLEDANFDNAEVAKYWKEEADCCAVMSYFSKRKY
jgi:hypothetical protein